MKRIKLLGLALIALIALGAFASAGAFAENPEILPVPTEAKPANFTSEAGRTDLHSTKDVLVICLKATNTGSFTTQDSGLVLIDFTECKSEGANCNSPGQAAGVILTLGLIQLVDVLPTGTLDLGVVIEPKEEGVEKHAKDLTFKCGGILSAVILGSVIGVVDNSAGALLKDLEKFKEVKVLWAEGASLGEQAIKECDLLKTFCAKGPFELKAEFGKGEELAAEIAKGTLKFEKEWEVHF